MLQLKTLVFNPYQENTYILYDENKNCIIVDPGMHNYKEEQIFLDAIQDNGLTPVSLINTHCHIDHVLGNHFIWETFGLMPQFHHDELPLLIQIQNYAPQMGIRYEPSPIPETFLSQDDIIQLGDHSIELILAPGHSPGHLCLYAKADNLLIGGDVLFQNSIGRTDLPMGNHQQLLHSITTKIYTLPENTIVYPGHGPSTTVGHEKQSNPFIRA